jgi:ABC-type sulfate transport system substrate-binding protein
MGNIDEPQPGDRNTEKECVSAVSALQIQLAAIVIDKIIEKNGGRAAADAFWDDDSFDFSDEMELDADLELRDSEEETVPEMDEINHNIFECD